VERKRQKPFLIYLLDNIDNIKKHIEKKKLFKVFLKGDLKNE